MRKTLVSAVIASFVTTNVLACDVPFFNTGMSGVRSLSTTSYGYSLSKEQVYKGSVSQRFEVRPGDCAGQPDWDDCKYDRERSEISVKNNNIMPGDKKWISWSIYLPKDFQTSDNVATTMGQIHRIGGPSSIERNMPSRPPLAMFFAKRNGYMVCLFDVKSDKACFTQKIMSIDDMRGKWTNIVVFIDTNKETGKFRIFVNGKIRVKVDQPVVQNDAEYFYFKYGIYRSFVSKHGGPMPTQIAYFDEVRMSNKRDHVDSTQCDLKPVD